MSRPLPSPTSRLRVAVVQLPEGHGPDDAVATAIRLAEDAARDGAQLVATPEYTNFHGLPRQHPEAATPIPGPVTDAFAATARRLGIHVLIGSLLEAPGPDGRFGATSVLLDPEGRIVATYRKIHLFDVAVGSEVVERESDDIAPGETVVTAVVRGRTLGMSICYDVRFPELYRALVERGAEILSVPAAFTAFTGRDHWEVLLRARAIESQCFVLAPARIGRWEIGTTFGNSRIVDPWGRVLAGLTDEPEGYAIADLDFEELARIRRELPSLANRRLR